MDMNYNVVMHIDSGEPDRFRLVARNCANYLSALPDEKFEIAVVANAGAASLFVGHDELRVLAEPLMAQGVRFKICANALREQNIDPVRLWPGCLVVPAGLVEIVKLQRAGYAYIKP